MKPDLLNKTEIAERFGVDVRSIELWVAQGMPRRKISGRPAFSWHDCRKWREQQIRSDERATRHAGGDEDRKKLMADARLQTAIAEAEMANLDLAQRRGELVTLDYMRAEFDRVCQALRARLLALPQSWAPRLGACVTTIDRQLELQNAINEVLPVLRELADDDGEDEPADVAPDPAEVSA